MIIYMGQAHKSNNEGAERGPATAFPAGSRDSGALLRRRRGGGEAGEGGWRGGEQLRLRPGGGGARTQGEWVGEEEEVTGKLTAGSI